MKSQKIIFTYLIIFLAFQTCFGQEKLKAELVGKFGRISNDPLQFRIINFIESIDSTNSKGYIIIHGANKDPLLKYLFEGHIKGCFRWGQRSIEKFVFAFSDERDEFEVELWKVPNGSDEPQFSETSRDYKLPNLTKPRLVYMLNISDEYCPLYFDMEFYSKFLKGNPYLNGKIVIYEKSLKGYQKVKQKYLRELTASNKIPPQQIKFTRGKYYGEPDVQFWFVPKNKK